MENEIRKNIHLTERKQSEVEKAEGNWAILEGDVGCE